MPYMYILECVDGSFYTGSTTDLPRRLWQHENGLGANHTAKRLPVKLVYAEEFDRVVDAFYREKQVQGWSRSKKMALMKNDWNRLHVLAECRNMSHYRGEAGFDADGFDSAQPSVETVRAERSRSPDSARTNGYSDGEESQ
jgi:putative endonuclease